ncbi:MAG: hypothetical protein JST11_15850 [Acidobacteria bacterium]|nr:hypothetical protein [Acidobacteriota bacterium]
MKLALLAICAAAFAQTARPPAAPARKQTPAPAPATASKWPIRSIQVEGNRIYTREQVAAVAGLKIGQLAGRDEFEAARDRLVASGAFETVGYRFEPSADKQGFAAIFQVTEVQPTFPVRFEDLGVPDRDIEAALAARDPLFSRANLPATKNVLDRYTSLVQQYLATKGITEPVAAKVVALSTDRFAIVIRPARGLPRVAEVTFTGDAVVPPAVLREAIHGVAIGSPYSEAGFREILNVSVRPIYEQRGRLRVSFPEVRAEGVKDVEGVRVFVKVDEGQVYELGKVTIAPPSPVDPATLLKAGDFKTGDIANFSRVSDGYERIRLAVRRAGYLNAKVSGERRIDDAKKTVDVEVRIEPGAPFTMGKLTLVGLDLNGEAEIKRIWTLKEGKAFNPEYPDRFLTRIREEGLFDNLGKTKADVKVNDDTHTADVTLTFGGAPSKPDRPFR